MRSHKAQAGSKSLESKHGILSWSRIQMYGDEDMHGINLLLLAHKLLFKSVRTSLMGNFGAGIKNSCKLAAVSGLHAIGLKTE